MKTKRAVELKNEGNKHFEQGNYDKALQCYGEAVELMPGYRDAWNNIYLTLLRQGRIGEATKCKEILDKLALDPKAQPKSMGFKHFSLVQKIFIVIITILLVIVVVLVTEAIMGVSSGKTGPGPVENTLTSLVASSPVSFTIPGNNSSGTAIPSSNDLISGSFDNVQKSLGAIVPIGLDIPINNASGSNTTIHS
ncbi:MAG: tetratricopeptide repeat protein [Methanomicrobiales archaeon]|nr:tetratricopeptide repeat protein [Methanomicrobiales archaeon]